MAVLCMISSKRSDITMHQNRNSLTPLRMYRVVHDAALHIHEEINDHPQVQEYLASFPTCMDSSAAKYFDEAADLKS